MYKKDLILREDCINLVKPFIDINIIKIIVGVRRSGKSYLLDMIGDEIISRGIDQDHIIYKLYTSVLFDDGFNKENMFSELTNMIIDNNKYYLLLDEVQEIDGWEKVINTLYENFNVDIYVTGSNSKLTSDNISSYLSGRYVLIPTYTLSFKEFIKFKSYENNDLTDAYKEYLKIGGFPLITISNLQMENNYQIIDGIYSSIISKDVMKNHPIKESDKFNRVVKFIMENVGKTFSANSIANYLKSQHREISTESIYNYIAWLKECFIIYECKRYDIRGKEVLKTHEKYYLSDISLRYALFGYNTTFDSSSLENIVFLEMKRRGYKVYIGKDNDKEIDFIGFRQGEEIHIQVCLELPSDSDREIKNLLNIKDSNHKYVVSANKNDSQFVNGIRVIYITDFLMLENW